MAIAATCAQANPQGAQVVHGTATFSQPSANVLNVTNSHNAVINWQSFNIGAGQTTNFIQPGSASAVLNQVLSNSPSQIYGNLNSNGQVFLINQHGLMIGAGAQINTAGFYGSTLNITNEDFLQGKLKFEGGGLGGIQNYGYIHAGPGGNVVLIAPDIENGGVIEVHEGNVILAAGESITITSLNDASIEFDLQSPDNGIVNLGSIIANQGAARLFAGNLKHSGAINATGIVRNADGSISLVAQQDIEVTATAILAADGDEGGTILVQSHHGDVHFSGNASAQGETGTGGKIEILGERVGLFADARVNASGKTGGGEVLIGGDYQGGGDTQTAMQTQVGPHASIHADALDSGDGGKVIVWADDLTLFQGEATARGGEDSGDGGFIEISGKGSLGYYGSVDASASGGEAGTILFDPIDVIIQSGGLDTLLNPLLFVIPGPLFTFDPTQITNITDMGNNVIIQADRDITINDDIITAEGGAGGDLTFQAGQSIFINANIFTDNGNLSLSANDFGADFTNRGGGVAEITMAPGTTIDATDFIVGGNIEISMEFGNGNGSGGDITLENLEADHIVLRVKPSDPGSDILQNAGGTITALSVFIDHEFSPGGTVGTAVNPLNLVVDSVSAHIHAATTGGIYIDARGNSTTDVEIGNTCYGTGIVVGCDTFGPHLITGLETVDGGGEIVFDVVGDLFVNDQVQTADPQLTTNPGDITLSATGAMISNANIINNTTSAQIFLNSPNPINLASGTYRGVLLAQGGGLPEVSGSVVFDNLTFDTDATLLNGSLVTVLNNFAVGLGRTLSGQGFVDASDVSAALINNGNIVSDGTGLTIDATLWFNNGNLIATNGSTLTLAGAALVNDGTLQADAGATISTLNQNFFNIGLVQGDGIFNVGTGTFNNDGTVAPGVGVDDPGVLTVLGNYAQSSTGVLNIELDGTSPGSGAGFHDQLVISGSASFDGLLNVAYVSGFVPNPLDGFSVATYGSLLPVAVIASLPTDFDPAAYNANSLDLLYNPAGGGFLWTGLGDGVSWGDPANWSLGVPTISDDVTIGVFSVNSAALAEANSLTLAAGGSLNLAASSLTIGDHLVINGSLTIQAGATLTVQDGILVDDLVVNPGGVLFNSDGVLNVVGNSLFDGSFSQAGLAPNSMFTGSVNFNGAFSMGSGSLQLTSGANMAGVSNSWSGGTISGGAPLVLVGPPGTTKLTLGGIAKKTLDGITLDSNANDIDVFGDGDLDLINGAIVLNQGGGFSFHHFSNGNITSTDGSGLFDNASSQFVNAGGFTTVSVDFTNNAEVLTLGGVLAFSGNFINTDTVNVAAGIMQIADVDVNDIGFYNVNAGGALVFSASRVLNGSLAMTGLVVADNGSTLTLPASLVNLGILELDTATLDLSNLGGTLQLDSSILSGNGVVNGNVVNNSGLLVVGGGGAVGNLTISGSYTQNPASAMVIEVFNDGFNTISDQLIVSGPTVLNGGTLVIGFTTTSLGIVTGNFIPFAFNGGLTGSFGQVVDAGGNILFLDVNGPVVTVLGASPLLPEDVIAALVKFVEERIKLEEQIASNKAKAEAVIREIEEAVEDEGIGPLVCN